MWCGLSPYSPELPEHVWKLAFEIRTDRVRLCPQRLEEVPSKLDCFVGLRDQNGGGVSDRLAFGRLGCVIPTSVGRFRLQPWQFEFECPIGDDRGECTLGQPDLFGIDRGQLLTETAFVPLKADIDRLTGDFAVGQTENNF